MYGVEHSPGPHQGLTHAGTTNKHLQDLVLVKEGLLRHTVSTRHRKTPSVDQNPSPLDPPPCVSVSPL